MNEADPKLRAYYALAETAEGETLERIRAAIAQRRRVLALDDEMPSAFDDVPPPPPEPERWVPPDPADYRPSRQL